MTDWIETAGSSFVIMERDYAQRYDAEKSYKMLEEDSNAVKLQTLHKTVNINTYEYNSESVALIIHKLKS